MSNRYPRKPDAALRTRDFAMSLDEIAREIGVSKERVRQIESQALATARVILARRGYTLEDLTGGGEHHG